MHAQRPRSACLAYPTLTSLEAVRSYLSMRESSKSRYFNKAVEARMQIYKGREVTSLNGCGIGSPDDSSFEIDGYLSTHAN